MHIYPLGVQLNVLVYVFKSKKRTPLVVFNPNRCDICVHCSPQTISASPDVLDVRPRGSDVRFTAGRPLYQIQIQKTFLFEKFTWGFRLSSTRHDVRSGVRPIGITSSRYHDKSMLMQQMKLLVCEPASRPCASLQGVVPWPVFLKSQRGWVITSIIKCRMYVLIH